MSITNQIRFTKVTGAGNDFILFDALNHVVPMMGAEVIQRICMRGLSVGADGVLILSPSPRADFRLHYYNADGTSGMLCANGARCAIIYAKKFFDIIGNKISFECCGKIYSGEIIDEKNVKFFVGDVTETQLTKIVIENAETEIFYADTGAPHVVADFKELAAKIGILERFDDFELKHIGAKIRHNPTFFPHGTNVNIVAIEDGKFKVRSYERGVENETLACGTGIIASAIYLSEVKGRKTPIELYSRSGKKFIVDFEKADGKYENVRITGEAEIVYFGEIYQNSFGVGANLD